MAREQSRKSLTAYYGVAPSILEGVIDQWLQRTAPLHSIERYTFLDVGAGKGVRCCWLRSFRSRGRRRGAELLPRAHRAKQHRPLAARRQGFTLAPITLHHADATDTHSATTPTLAFLFHPFEDPV